MRLFRMFKGLTLIEWMIIIAIIGILMAVAAPMCTGSKQGGCNVNTDYICKNKCMSAMNPQECLKICEDLYKH